MNKTLQIALNIIAVLASIIFFTLVLFPLDAAISHGLARVETQTKGKGDWRVSVSKIDASLIFDTQFEDFRIFQKDVEVFSAPILSVDTSLFSLLSGKVNVEFTAEYKKGELAGRVVLGDSSLVDLEFDEFSLNELSYVNQLLTQKGYDVKLFGVADGLVSLDWQKAEGQGTQKAAFSLNEGAIHLKITSAEIDHLKVAAWNFDLPKMVLSSEKEPLEINIEVGKNQILINRVNIPGPDLSLTLNGSLGLDRTQSVARFSLDGRFSFADEIKTKIPLLAMIEKQMTPEGFYPISIRGSAKKPEIQIGDFELSSFLQMTTMPPSSEGDEEGSVDQVEAVE